MISKQVWIGPNQVVDGQIQVVKWSDFLNLSYKEELNFGYFLGEQTLYAKTGILCYVGMVKSAKKTPYI